MSPEFTQILIDSLITSAKIAAFVVPCITVLLWWLMRQCTKEEAKMWNNGYCARNGEPWVLSHYTRNGSRIYTAGPFNVLHISSDCDGIKK